MTTTVWLASVALVLAPQPHSPYAGQEKRAIKVLSDADVQALLDGSGMGLAMPAELNQYPGPRHVLDNAETLRLSEAQRVSIEASYQRMKAEAVSLGRQVVDVERRLDALFARREASAGAVENLTQEAAQLQGQLRAVHLRAHVEVRALLTPEQIHRYVELRGYGHQGH